MAYAWRRDRQGGQTRPRFDLTSMGTTEDRYPPRERVEQNIRGACLANSLLGSEPAPSRGTEFAAELNGVIAKLRSV